MTAFDDEVMTADDARPPAGRKWLQVLALLASDAPVAKSPPWRDTANRSAAGFRM